MHLNGVDQLKWLQTADVVGSSRLCSQFATTSSIFTVTYDVPLSVNIPFGFRCLVSATVRADGPRLRLLSSSIGDFVFTRQRPNETDRQRSGGRGKGVSAPATRFRQP